MSRLAKLHLAIEIIASYLLTRWYLRQGPLPGVVARLRAAGRSPLTGPLGADQAPRLGRAVGRTLAGLPADSRCLFRSLVLLRVLARRGVAGSLVIAARPESRDGFDAHAWVEVKGRPVLPAASPGYGRLVTL
jgi:hypothetical protein